MRKQVVLLLRAAARGMAGMPMPEGHGGDWKPRRARLRDLKREWNGTPRPQRRRLRAELAGVAR